MLRCQQYLNSCVISDTNIDTGWRWHVWEAESSRIRIIAWPVNLERSHEWVYEVEGATVGPICTKSHVDIYECRRMTDIVSWLNCNCTAVDRPFSSVSRKAHATT